MDFNKTPGQAIVELIEYLEHDEREHFEEMQRAGEDVSNRIYLSAKAMKVWLVSQGITWRDPQAEFKASIEAAFVATGVPVAND